MCGTTALHRQDVHHDAAMCFLKTVVEIDSVVLNENIAMCVAIGRALFEIDTVVSVMVKSRVEWPII